MIFGLEQKKGDNDCDCCLKLSICISSKALGAFALIKRLQKFLLLLFLSHFTLLILDLLLGVWGEICKYVMRVGGPWEGAGGW